MKYTLFFIVALLLKFPNIDALNIFADLFGPQVKQCLVHNRARYSDKSPEHGPPDPLEVFFKNIERHIIGCGDKAAKELKLNQIAPPAPPPANDREVTEYVKNFYFDVIKRSCKGFDEFDLCMTPVKREFQLCNLVEARAFFTLGEQVCKNNGALFFDFYESGGRECFMKPEFLRTWSLCNYNKTLSVGQDEKMSFYKNDACKAATYMKECEIQAFAACEAPQLVRRVEQFFSKFRQENPGVGDCFFRYDEVPQISTTTKRPSWRRKFNWPKKNKHQ